MMHARADSLLNAENRMASLQRMKSAAPISNDVVKPAETNLGKPRRALGDITNKSGKEASSGKNEIQKAAPRIELIPSQSAKPAPARAALKNITNTSDGRTKRASIKTKSLDEFDMSRDERVVGGMYNMPIAPFESGIDIAACKAALMNQGSNFSMIREGYPSEEFAVPLEPETHAEFTMDDNTDFGISLSSNDIDSIEFDADIGFA